MKTKNLFDYATKELSQDAFLRWLFESWENQDVNACVRALLKEFCELQDNEEIDSVRTIAQHEKIDIVAEVLIKGGKNKALFIEDKTFSNHHDNQLKVYNGIIEKEWKQRGWEVYKVFYKTSKLSSEDLAAVENSGWEPYDIAEIYKIYEKFADTNDTILSQYISYLSKINEIYKNNEMPRENASKTDYMMWDAFFINAIIPKIDCPDIVWKSIIVYQSKVTCLRGYKKDTLDTDGKPTVPFIEVQSGDFYPKKESPSKEYRLNPRILCYDIPDSNKLDSNRDKIREEIDRTREETNGSERLFKTIKRYKQQVGQANCPENISNTEDFIEKLKVYVDEYLRLISVWET